MKRRHLIAGVTIGALLLAAVVTFVALGGLRARPLDRRHVAPGEDMDAGNLVYAFTSATVQYDATTSGDPWTVTVSGRVRNQTESTQTVIEYSPQSLIGVAPGMPNTNYFVYDLGEPGDEYTTHNPRWVVPPSNRWMTLTVRFTYPEGYQPTATYQVAAPPLTFSNTWVFGLGDTPTWHRSSATYVWLVEVPCQRLPDKTE